MLGRLGSSSPTRFSASTCGWGGCRGFKLFFDLEEAAATDDVVTEVEGVRIVVQEDGLPLVAGSILDFEDSYRGRGFRLANPRARNACGCGTSFMADYPGQAEPESELVVAEAPTPH